MRLHRFYINLKLIELKKDFWVKDDALLNQWLKVLRYRAGDEVVLFDGVDVERLYKISEVGNDAVHLKLVTEFERKLPKKHIYLFWSLLKKDKNEWVIQKCTEIGVSNFVPIVADRSEKTGFNLERAQKIAIEASEQCGRSDIPHIREPLTIEEAISEYRDKVELLVCEGNDEWGMTHERTEYSERAEPSSFTVPPSSLVKTPLGAFIGPEGGWTESEIAKFKDAKLGSLHLGNLTLRAETATVVASTKLVQ